ncbi:MAG TPA: universal stress protein, partial [Vicinamibacterales bacterium]|nr:universal stress protein [Vicinamibacterales bacterium]
LDRLRDDLVSRGLTVDTKLALGNPADELVRVAEEQDVDLIAMSTHGHRFVKDVLLGATADKVRHLVKVPVLLLRAQSLEPRT